VTGTIAQVFALRASNGAPLWQANLGNDLQNAYLPPVIDNGTLYVAAANIHPQSASDPLLTIFALHADTGKELWAAGMLGDPAQQYILLAFTIANGILYYNAPDGSLNAERFSDLRLWRHPFPPRFFGGILGTNESAVFVDATDSIQALAITDGHTLWQHSTNTL
jgi:outer membrane protein assembly factor BamB